MNLFRMGLAYIQARRAMAIRSAPEAGRAPAAPAQDATSGLSWSIRPFTAAAFGRR